ncbi:MAG: tripartite tricarboxylate transporter substrate-binding protein [Paracraurococcus sp.]
MPARRGLLALAAAGAVGTPALAQRAWPSGPIRFIVSFPPGGSVDLVARSLQAPLQRSLDVPVVVENRTGASGAIGTGAVVRAAPDGQTFLVVSDIHAALPALIPDLPFDSRRDLAPVMLIGTAPMLLCAHRSRPWRDMAAMMADARARPEHITCGTSGNGTLAHLAMEMMQQTGGFRTTHVPYRGGAPLVQAVIAGELDLCIASAAPIGRLVQDGTLVPLVQTGAARSALLPAVPTAQEAGLPGIDATAFWCVLAPAAVPKPVLQAFHAALVEALAPAEMRAKFRENFGIEVVASSAAEFGRYLDDQMDVWAKVIRERNIRPD